MFVDESHVTIGQFGGMYNGDRRAKPRWWSTASACPALDNRPLKFEEFGTQDAPGGLRLGHAAGLREGARRPGGRAGGAAHRPGGPHRRGAPATHQVDDVLQEIRLRVEADERVLITTLTKRMAEQLTDYLSDNGVKVRYLHSDVDTVERVEILRDLRLGPSTCWWASTCCARGLDIPEVSLVAILDADKEGFLRSERSLIQTIGRAARNLTAVPSSTPTVVTDSMRRAIGETERRAGQANAFNAEHGITPRGMSKAVKDLIDGVYARRRQKGRLDQSCWPPPRSRSCPRRTWQAHGPAGKADAGARPQPGVRAGSPFARPTGPAARAGLWRPRAGPGRADLGGGQGARERCGIKPQAAQGFPRYEGESRITQRWV